MAFFISEDWYQTKVSTAWISDSIQQNDTGYDYVSMPK